MHDKEKSLVRDDDTNDRDDTQQSFATSGLSRREVISAAGVLGVAGLGGAVLTAEAKPGKGKGNPPPFETQVFPKYYPLSNFTPEISLAGKFAVITGASRGIGRATAEALSAQGVTVIGTSRNVATVPNPPVFPLLDLDITSDASVDAFHAALISHPSYPGQIDILINNAGRYTIGTPIPPPIAPNPNQFYIDQLNIGVETIYQGHIRVTNKLLPLMTPSGYSRILYTVSAAGYIAGGTEASSALGYWGLHAYTAGKGALRFYANNLRAFLGVSGSNIKVATVNPFVIDTTLPDGLNPVFTEPVDANGNSPSNPVLQAILDGLRFAQHNGLPVSFVADTYVQLLSVAEPEPNVAVASPDEPFATMGGNDLGIAMVLEENEESVLTYGCAPPGQS